MIGAIKGDTRSVDSERAVVFVELLLGRPC